jgi:hypothetical protein
MKAASALLGPRRWFDGVCPISRLFPSRVIMVVQAIHTFANVFVEFVKHHGDHAAQHRNADYIEHKRETPFSIPSM